MAPRDDIYAQDAPLQVPYPDNDIRDDAVGRLGALRNLRRLVEQVIIREERELRRTQSEQTATGNEIETDHSLKTLTKRILIVDVMTMTSFFISIQSLQLETTVRGCLDLLLFAFGASNIKEHTDRDTTGIISMKRNTLDPRGKDDGDADAFWVAKIVFLIQAEVILTTLLLILMVYKYHSRPSIRQLKRIIVSFLLKAVFYIAVALAVFFDVVTNVEPKEWSFDPTNFLFGVVIGVTLENFLLALFQAIEFRDTSAFLDVFPTKSTIKFTLYLCAYLLIGAVSSTICLRVLTNRHPVNGTAEVENT